MRTSTTIATLALALALALASACSRTDAGSPAPRAGRYADVNGVRMYYEVHGSGRPIVLLHGAFCTIEACLG